MNEEGIKVSARPILVLTCLIIVIVPESRLNLSFVSLIFYSDILIFDFFKFFPVHGIILYLSHSQHINILIILFCVKICILHCMMQPAGH